MKKRVGGGGGGGGGSFGPTRICSTTPQIGRSQEQIAASAAADAPPYMRSRDDAKRIKTSIQSADHTALPEGVFQVLQRCSCKGGAVQKVPGKFRHVLIVVRGRLPSLDEI